MAPSLMLFGSRKKNDRDLIGFSTSLVSTRGQYSVITEFVNKTWPSDRLFIIESRVRFRF